MNNISKHAAAGGEADFSYHQLTAFIFSAAFQADSTALASGISDTSVHQRFHRLPESVIL